jgi:hypothetical protein
MTGQTTTTTTVRTEIIHDIRDPSTNHLLCKLRVGEDGRLILEHKTRAGVFVHTDLARLLQQPTP